MRGGQVCHDQACHDQVWHDPAQQGDGVSLRDQTQPQFGLIPAAQMTHNDVASARYNNLDDDDCAA